MNCIYFKVLGSWFGLPGRSESKVLFLSGVVDTAQKRDPTDKTKVDDARLSLTLL